MTKKLWMAPGTEACGPLNTESDDPCRCDHDYTQHTDMPMTRRTDGGTPCDLCDCTEYIPTAWTPEQEKMRTGVGIFNHPDWLQ